MKKSPNQGSQLAGKLWMIIMGLFLMAVGCLFVAYLWAFFQKSRLMDDWVKTPCAITKSEIDNSRLTQHYSTKYTLVVAYRYFFEGKEFLGHRYQRLQPASADQKKIERKLKPFPLGAETVCFVDPKNPEMAVLKRDSKGSVYSIWFPGLFVLGGFGMIVSAFLRPKDSKSV